MNAFEAYQIYLGLRQHFTTSYDYVKYKGRTRATVKSFEKRKDIYYFKTLAKHKDPFHFVMANLLDGRSYLNEFEEYIYLEFLRRRESLTYNFKGSIKKMSPDFNRNFAYNEGRVPLLDLSLSNEIDIECLVVWSSLANCQRYWSIGANFVYEDIINKIVKYSPFLPFDRNKFRDIVMNNFHTNTQDIKDITQTNVEVIF